MTLVLQPRRKPMLLKLGNLFLQPLADIVPPRRRARHADLTED